MLGTARSISDPDVGAGERFAGGVLDATVHEVARFEPDGASDGEASGPGSTLRSSGAKPRARTTISWPMWALRQVVQHEASVRIGRRFAQVVGPISIVAHLGTRDRLSRRGP